MDRDSSGGGGGARERRMWDEFVSPDNFMRCMRAFTAHMRDRHGACHSTCPYAC